MERTRAAIVLIQQEFHKTRISILEQMVIVGGDDERLLEAFDTNEKEFIAFGIKCTGEHKLRRLANSDERPGFLGRWMTKKVTVFNGHLDANLRLVVQTNSDKQKFYDKPIACFPLQGSIK